MSLEAALAETTAALKALTDILKENNPTPPVELKLVSNDSDIAEPETPDAVAEPEPEPESEVSYKDLKVVILELSKLDRAEASKILSEFGAERGPDLKEEQYADALARLQAAVDACKAEAA